jgi:hypothetical protein
MFCCQQDGFTDLFGQVFVDRSLHNRQIYPPINVPKTKRRVGGWVDQPQWAIKPGKSTMNFWLVVWNIWLVVVNSG